MGETRDAQARTRHDAVDGKTRGLAFIETCNWCRRQSRAASRESTAVALVALVSLRGQSAPANTAHAGPASDTGEGRPAYWGTAGGGRRQLRIAFVSGRWDATAMGNGRRQTVALCDSCQAPNQGRERSAALASAALARSFSAPVRRTKQTRKCQLGMQAATRESGQATAISGYQHM